MEERPRPKVRFALRAVIEPSTIVEKRGHSYELQRFRIADESQVHIVPVDVCRKKIAHDHLGKLALNICYS